MSLHRKFPAAVVVIVLSSSPVIAQEWTLTTAPQVNWRCIASSADGRKLVAAVYPGLMYISTNSGSTWTPTSAPNRDWTSVACSADGSTIVAAAQYGFGGGNGVFVSVDSGATWPLVFSPSYHFWNSVACSSEGKRLVAASSAVGGWATNAIYISTNSGADWTLTSAPGEYADCVASSADGSRLAVAASASVYTSANFGLDWMPTHPTDPTPQGDFHFVATSGTGATLLTLFSANSYPLPGIISISSDWGASWKPVGALFNLHDSESAACSADGVTLAVVESYLGGTYPTRVSVSTNSGALWSATQFSSTNLCSVTSSADGSRLALALSGHGIYVLQTTTRPVLKTLPRAAGIQLSWLVPSELFVLQESPDLSAWSDVDATTVFNDTNLNYEVELPRPIGPKFYRLSSR